MKLSYKYHTFNIPLRLLLLLKRHIVFVRAAGGIVSAPDGHMLLILRNGRWDLPKGKVEAGETLLQAALRETAEETGIEATPAGCRPLPLVKTYHSYNLYGGWHLKQTTWFAARATGHHPAGRPQGEEGIAAVVWVRPDEWRRRLEHSYGTMRTIVKHMPWTD